MCVKVTSLCFLKEIVYHHVYDVAHSGGKHVVIVEHIYVVCLYKVSYILYIYFSAVGNQRALVVEMQTYHTRFPGLITD